MTSIWIEFFRILVSPLKRFPGGSLAKTVSPRQRSPIGNFSSGEIAATGEPLAKFPPIGDLGDPNKLVFCDWCGATTRLEFHQGHYQCTACKRPLADCCDGEQAENGVPI